MNVRWFVLLAVFGGLCAGGCGEGPQAEFVVSERTGKLIEPARAQVQSSLDASFGTPQKLVAWRRLPVDFGEYAGVVGQGTAKSLKQFTASLTPKSDRALDIGSFDLKGAGLVWTSGSYKDAKYLTKGGQEGYLDFHVVEYDADAQALTVESNQPGLVDSSEAPAAGDEFVILGPVQQHGRTLYMTHCLHCHGVSGDGAGPTASYLNPPPRDYRQGKFKFTSTAQTERAQRADLRRTIKQGIPGTLMPSFMLMEDDEVDAIVEYIRWLAVRGEYETKLVVEFEAGGFSQQAFAQRVNEGESQEAILEELGRYIEDEFAAVSESAASDLSDVWHRAELDSSVVLPKKARTPDTPESRERGRKLFLSGRAKCADCHGPAGRGNGRQTEDYNKIPGTNDEYPEPGLYDDWNNKLEPRNLTRGIYRGGRRPVDLYRRIYAGIKGTPMPPFSTVLNDDEIWDLVNYVMSVPYAGPGAGSVEGEQKVASHPVSGGER